ncbi:helix-turn-helix transcriptional regulator [Oscillatoria sp. FACHB-1407]|uniref:ArsR/SmtB family transcription factor n=1 Tax=Oscillatoria sp. FACHB-1407 TaxID=2692847 RepID=UPI0016838AB3|nr:metalloregulator ArsR/SmtB family transcription factor [Oscillatoria sp. FACHB-1407]MBD2464577.1 helix-turn-helix transcriptional regulator [Oscillatoria sp. FACHB-1407]
MPVQPMPVQPPTLDQAVEQPKQGCCRAIASTSLSEAQAQKYAEWFKVLADPTRLRILNLLAQNKEPLCVCDIVDQFDLGQPTISHHLKLLRNTCFVKTERRANFIYYSINHECIPALPQAAQQIMGI